LAQYKQRMPDHVLDVKVDLQGWTARQVRALCQLVIRHAGDFSTSKWDIGECAVLPMRIALKEGAKVFADKPYRYSPHFTNLIKVEIDKLLAAGIIRPSMSEYSSPVVAVMKPDGTARITVNYKKLNSNVVVPQIPLPNIEDLLNELGGSKLFTTLDITSGFFTCSLHPDSVPLTAMATSFGLFEYTRAPQGFAGSPAHFTRMMGLVLQGLERVRPYIDDVIINSRSVGEHLGDLAALMQRLHQHGIKVAPRKMHIGCQRVKYLGHVLTPQGISVDPDKVRALTAMPVPTNVSTLRAWLGLASYYRRFVKGMARIVAPLNALLGQGVEFLIGDVECAAVHTVNTILAEHTLMRYPDYVAASSGERPFIVATDACKEGFGAVLSQRDGDGLEQPIAFASRSTLKYEKKWSTTDLEAGAIVYGIRKFRHLLYGIPFVIHTDHRALLYMESLRDKTARGARWHEFMQAFQFTIQYKAGITHGNADGVSRNACPVTAEDAREEAEAVTAEAYSVEQSPAAWDAAHACGAPSVQAELLQAELAQYVQECGGEQLAEVAAWTQLVQMVDVVQQELGAPVEHVEQQEPATVAEIMEVLSSSVTCTQAVESGGLAVHAVESTEGDGSNNTGKHAAAMTPVQWQRAQEADSDLAPIIAYLRHGTLPQLPPEELQRDAAEHVRQLHAAEQERHRVITLARDCFLCHQQGAELLLRADWQQRGPKGEAGPPGLQLAVPRAQRDHVLNSLHGTSWAGHGGVSRTLAVVRRHVWWPSWTADTAYWVTHCVPCQARKRDGRRSFWPLVWRDRPRAPFDTVAIDYFGRLPASGGGHVYILVVQCVHSKWVELYAVTADQATAEGTAQLLVDQFCTRHGPPRAILSDRGSTFMSQLSAAFYKQMGVRKLSTTAFHPQCNGMVERFMHTMADMLALAVHDEPHNWHLWLPHVAYAYNTKPHTATGVSPFLLLHGREPRLALHQLLGGTQWAVGDDTPVDVRDRIDVMLERQRSAAAVADARHELRRRAAMADPARARAFGRLPQFTVGSKAWVYQQPQTESSRAPSDAVTGDVALAGLQERWSKKLKDYWSECRTVLAVGPGEWDGKPLSERNIVLQLDDGSGKRYSINRCKPMHDPGEAPPTTLPSGFARYLLTRQQPSLQGLGLSSGGRVTVPPPHCLDDTSADASAERSLSITGISHIQGHRVARRRRGIPSVLEYLVCWRDGTTADSWEQEHWLEQSGCEALVHDYWEEQRRRGEAGGAVRDHGTALVNARMALPQRRLGYFAGVLEGRGAYRLPAGARALPDCPSEAVLVSSSFVGAQLMVVFCVGKGTPGEHLRWYHGEVVKPPAKPSDRIASKRSRSGFALVQFADKSYAVPTRHTSYSTRPSAAEGSWFIFGTAQQLADLS
jgi:hypothetical protein